VVEDHLRFALPMAFGLLAEVDEAARIEQGIGVALEPARVPRQVDQQAVEDLLA
jgi:hypothetical protein